MPRKTFKLTVLVAVLATYAVAALLLWLFQSLLAASLVLTIVASGATLALLAYVQSYNFGAATHQLKYRVAMMVFMTIAGLHGVQTLVLVTDNQTSWLFWPEAAVIVGTGIAFFVRYVDQVKKADSVR